MKKYISFSKSSDDIKKIKKIFFTNNNKFLSLVKYYNKIYNSQPLRRKCKNCEKDIGKILFSSHKVKYLFCKNCHHLNGRHQDTDYFLKKLYAKNEPKSNYGFTYYKNYNLKVKNIYEPKVHFLKKVIKKKFSIIDFGSGTGLFLKACENLSIYGKGIETNRDFVNFSNLILKKNKTSLVNLNNSYDYIKYTDADCVSLINVLEHVQKPNKVFENFKISKAKYLFINVPLFSFTTFIENAFAKVSPRHLFGPHTHLYTHKSLEYIIKKKNLKIIGEWWFGSDFLDLSRSLLLTFNNNNKNFEKCFDNFYGKYVDNFQSVLDKKKISSEVHLVISK